MKRLDENLTVETKVFKEIWYTGKWLDIQGNLIIVKAGFEFDGCTCSKDQPRNRIACCVHDALLFDLNVPVTRKQKDKVFYELLKENKFRLGGWVPFSPQIYYIGVRLQALSGMFRK